MSFKLVPAAAVAVLLLALIPAAATSAPGEPTVEDNIVVESFDGTPIVATLLLPAGASADHPVPIVFKTHGWGGTRDKSIEGLNGRLLQKGYALLTWDARGFGQSGGEANVDSPDFEVKDTSALIDYAATRPEIAKDAPNDPRMGWVGGSYAGGIQLNTAAFDHRPDALVPEIPWADLVQDLFPNRVIKRSWDQLLYAAGAATAALNGLDSPAGPQIGVYAQEIHRAEVMGSTTGDIPEDLTDWFSHKSTIRYAGKITTPTMIMQGSIDTLFPLEDGFQLYQKIRANGTPVKLVSFCGGHTIAGCTYPGGSSGTPKGKGNHYEDLMIAWLDRYVMGSKVDTGPALEWEAQDGYYYGANSYPVPGIKAVNSEKFTVTLAGPGGTGGDGAANGAPAPASELGVSAAHTKVVPAARKTSAVVGIPQVKVTGSVVGAGAYVFFELLDKAPDGTLVTVNDQTMPVRLELGDFKATLDLHGLTWMLEKGHSLILEITTGSTQYDTPRTGPYALDLEVVAKVPVTSGGVAKGDRTSK